MKKILPHICIVLALVVLTLLIVDQINSAMGLVNNQGAKIIFMVFAVLVIVLAVLYAAEHRK